MLSKFVTSFVLALGLIVPAAASDYYVGVSDIDTELTGGLALEDGGYALTIGTKLNLVEAFDTAAEFTYSDFVDKTFTAEGYEFGFAADSIDLSLVMSRAYGSFRPFVRLGISQMDSTFTEFGEFSGEEKEDETSDYYGFGVDFEANDRVFIRLEMTETDVDDTTVELTKFGVFTRF